MIKIFRDQNDYLLQNSRGTIRSSSFSIDELFTAAEPLGYAVQFFDQAKTEFPKESDPIPWQPWLAPVCQQEIWAAGVTYFRSRTARMEESETTGGEQFYDRVYEAPRPELFFKANGHRARGHLEKVGIRSDSRWNVPEPELTLAINSSGSVFGYTIGNDMSSRSIEGENPLYLPQAKIYRGSCAIGPCLVIGEPVRKATKISILIARDGAEVFSGSTTVSQIKRSFDELVEYLFRDNEFPYGVYLMTGTGVVPDADFTLASGDLIRIEISGIGILENEVE